MDLLIHYISAYRMYHFSFKLFASTLLKTVILMIALSTGPLFAQTSEHELKAVFLFNFTQFVTWPDSSIEDEKAPFRICIFGDHQFGSTINQVVSGEKVGPRPIAVERIASDEKLSSCQILFLAEASNEESDYLLRQVAGQPILTVGEGAVFAEKGGIIGWYIADNKLRLRINLPASRSAKLNISSKLLRLSEVIGAEE